MASIKEILDSSIDLVFPHARKEPLNPMSYVRDVNEWFLPAAQMYLDEMEGRENYPSWSYILASVPVVGKVGKAAAKSARKSLSKAEKLKIIAKNNPAPDNFHTWVRTEDDILDFPSARKYTYDDIGGDSSFPDVTKELLDEAERTGKIRLYSSNPFSLGSFVSPSKMQAQDYAGNGKIYEGVFDLDDIAWINADEGQIARMPK